MVAKFVLLVVLGVVLELSSGYKHVDHFEQKWVRKVHRIGEPPFMTVPETIRFWGYPAEEHFVTTSDEYILGVHRIPHGIDNEDGNNGTKPVVFLAHGMLSSSSQWAFGPPDKSFAYILADAGYDVWMGNTRGNTYSRNHTTLDPCSTCADFWSYGWGDSGIHDYSAELDYILEKTGQDSLHFIGHSMGTTQLMVLLSERPEYNNKIKDAYLMGPAVFMTHANNPIFWLAEWADDIMDLYHLFGLYEFLPHSDLMTWLGHVVCNVEEHPIMADLCANAAFLLMGINLNQLNMTMAPIYLDHLPEGTSTRPLVHYAQLHVTDNEFVKYDFGSEEENMANYGTVKPPAYDLSNVQVPVALFVGDKDDKADVQDAEHLAQVLPNVFHHEVVDYKGWTHLDFAIAIDAASLVYEPILKMLLDHP